MSLNNTNNRVYDRISVDTGCIVYINNKENVGTIVNISENGLGISLVLNKSSDSFKLYDTITVLTPDMNMVNRFTARIIRLDKHDNELFVGARIVNTSEVETYVLMKKAEKYSSEVINNINL